MHLRKLGWMFATLILLGFLTTWQEAQGQIPGPGIGFRNDLKTPVIVQGVSLVNKMQRRGQPFLVNPGKIVWDANLPLGIRYYTIYDANQRILLPNQAVPVQAKDQFFAIRVNMGNPIPVKLEPEAVPVPNPPQMPKQ